MNNGISESLITNQFFHSMNACGITPRETFSPNMDGKTHRFAVEHDKSGAKSGAYFIHADDCPNWGVMDFHIHSSMQTFSFDLSVLDADTRREYLKQNNISNVQGISGTRTITETQHKEIERKKEAKANANKEIQQAALRMALREYLYADLFGVFQHQYLRSRFTDKGIRIEESTAFNIRDKQTPDEPKNYRPPADRMPLAISMGSVNGGICKPGELLIPMRNVLTGEFQSLIHVPVKPDKEGKFLKLNYKGLTIQGAAHFLTPKFSEFADCLFVCEGIATAIALLVDLREKYPIFSAGSCGNLYPVCEGLRKRYPNKRIVLVADNDKNGAGINAANKCRNAGLVDGIRMPEISGHDWYDRLITRKGI